MRYDWVLRLIELCADGFALSVYPVDSSDEVSAILDLASNGGGLGFNIPSTSCASASDCEPNFDCRESVCVIDSFHIEFDTWENGYDPTCKIIWGSC